MCQRIKNQMEALAEKLKLSEVPEKPWTHLMVDFITKLLLVVEKDTILVVCDKLLKMTHFVVTTKGLMQLLWKLYGLLESIVSDKRPQFTVELMRKLNRMLEIKTKLLTMFHPQINRQIKQMNQELE